MRSASRKRATSPATVCAKPWSSLAASATVCSRLRQSPRADLARLSRLFRQFRQHRVTTQSGLDHLVQPVQAAIDHRVSLVIHTAGNPPCFPSRPSRQITCHHTGFDYHPARPSR